MTSDRTFDVAVIGQLEQQLLGAIRSAAVRGDPGGPQRKRLRQFRPQALRQAGHVVPSLDAPAIQPVTNLLQPVRWMTPLLEPASQCVLGGFKNTVHGRAARIFPAAQYS